MRRARWKKAETAIKGASRKMTQAASPRIIPRGVPSKRSLLARLGGNDAPLLRNGRCRFKLFCCHSTPRISRGVCQWKAPCSIGCEAMNLPCLLFFKDPSSILSSG